jgi:hypothetical protein
MLSIVTAVIRYIEFGLFFNKPIKKAPKISENWKFRHLIFSMPKPFSIFVYFTAVNEESYP